MRTLRATAAAWSLLTIVPLPGALGRRLEASDWARSSAAFPFVGAVIGAALAAFALVAVDALGPWAGAAATVIASAILTGGLHLDGLADACDALGARGSGGQQRERRLEIMRDSSTGTYGTLGLASALLLQTATLASLSLAGNLTLATALLLTPALGRTMAIAHAARLPSARPAGLGASFVVSRAGLAMALGSAAAIAAVIAAGRVVDRHDLAALDASAFALAGALLGLGLTTRLARTKLGGYTGDTIGATVVAAETLALVGFLAAS